MTAAAPIPATQVNPALTDDLVAFWADQLRALAKHQRAPVLAALANRYGIHGAERIRKAGRA